ncbi:MAG TPA: hypothetical protein VFN38_11720 [Gemmatimonadaceae bacterium]|nr:hypothetical protein [Gemmatimonadaceae bacterium]
MITGHLGVAAAARSRWPTVSLAWLLPAAFAPDLLDVGYAFAGICSPYGLYSHTVPAAALAAAVLGGLAFLATGSRIGGCVVAAVVMAHLPLDLVTGFKIYWPGGPLLGMYLYERPLLDFAAEAPVVLAGWWLLRRTGKGPRWASLAVTALGLVLLQGTFDLLHRGLKPTGCRWSAIAEP